MTVSANRVVIIILTLNEEANLPRCLSALPRDICDVVVVDSGSIDRTPGIAVDHGAVLLSRPFTNHSEQFNWALDQVGVENYDWVVRLDADEEITAEFRRFLRAGLTTMNEEVSGITVGMRIMFMGSWLRFGGLSGIRLLRIWRPSDGEFESRLMDEHLVLRRGKTVDANIEFVHWVHGSLSEWFGKHVRYAHREAAEALFRPPQSSQLGSAQARRKRYLKGQVYDSLPLFLRCWLFWLYRYVGRGGFLDGKAGFIYHFFQGLVYRSLVDFFIVGRDPETLRFGSDKLRTQIEKNEVDRSFGQRGYRA